MPTSAIPRIDIAALFGDDPGARDAVGQGLDLGRDGGAGLGLALACDLRVATTTASFGAVFHRVGLTGDFGLLWLLPRVVGPARAAQLESRCFLQLTHDDLLISESDTAQARQRPRS